MNDEIDNETAERVIMEFGRERPDKDEVRDMKRSLQTADLVPAQRLRDAEARAERLEKTLHLMDCYLGQGSPSGARRAYQEATTSQNTAPPRTAVYKVLIDILGDRRS